MSNNDIVIWVYNNVDVDKFVKKVIDRTSLERNYDDLTQYVYLTLLEYDNEKLNRLYNEKVLKQFIMGIILNQRNYYKSYYNSHLRLYGKEIQESDLNDYGEYDFEREDKINFINNELKKYKGHRNNLSKTEEDEMLRLQFYYIYLTRGITLKELSIRMDMNYRTILRLIRSAKEIIRNNYYKK